MNKETIVRKLTSRKLWMALAAFISGVVTVIWGDKTAQIVGGLVLQFAAVVAYIVGEGLVDAAASKPPNGEETDSSAPLRSAQNDRRAVEDAGPYDVNDKGEG